MLRKRGPTAFKRFIDALKSCGHQKYIAEYLLQQLANDSTASSKTDEQIIETVKGCISLLCVTLLKFKISANLCTSHVCVVGQATDVLVA